MIWTDFGMAGGAGAHGLVLRRRLVAAGIAGDGAGDALDVLEDALHAPEAAAGEHGDLGRRSALRRLVGAPAAGSRAASSAADRVSS